MESLHSNERIQRTARLREKLMEQPEVALQFYRSAVRIATTNTLKDSTSFYDVTEHLHFAIREGNITPGAEDIAAAQLAKKRLDPKVLDNSDILAAAKYLLDRAA